MTASATPEVSPTSVSPAPPHPAAEASPPATAPPPATSPESASPGVVPHDGPAVPDARTGPLEALIRRLEDDFPHVGRQEIALVVSRAADGYRHVRIKQYVHIFVERESRERLRDGSVPRPRDAAGEG